MSWGTELWDKYEDLCSHTNEGIDFLEKSVAEFVKERGKVEKEYAKSLRTLVKKFMPKGTKVSSSEAKNNESGPASIVLKQLADEEPTHLTAYKEVRNFPRSIFLNFFQVMGHLTHLCQFFMNHKAWSHMLKYDPNHLKKKGLIVIRRCGKFL